MRQKGRQNKRERGQIGADYGGELPGTLGRCGQPQLMQKQTQWPNKFAQCTQDKTGGEGKCRRRGTKGMGKGVEECCTRQDKPSEPARAGANNKTSGNNNDSNCRICLQFFFFNWLIPSPTLAPNLPLPPLSLRHFVGSCFWLWGHNRNCSAIVIEEVFKEAAAAKLICKTFAQWLQCTVGQGRQ